MKEPCMNLKIKYFMFLDKNTGCVKMYIDMQCKIFTSSQSKQQQIKHRNNQIRHKQVHLKNCMYEIVKNLWEMNNEWCIQWVIKTQFIAMEIKTIRQYNKNNITKELKYILIGQTME